MPQMESKFVIVKRRHSFASAIELLGTAVDTDPLVTIAEELFNRWSNTREGSPHRIITEMDAIRLRNALALRKLCKCTCM